MKKKFTIKELAKKNLKLSIAQKKKVKGGIIIEDTVII